jgi:hypothetical protein
MNLQRLGIGLTGWLAIACLVGCGPSTFETYFVPESDKSYRSPVEQVRIVQIGDRNPLEVQQQLYPQHQLLGVSQFTGTKGSAGTLEKFAKSIGADVVIWHTAWLSTHSQTDYNYYPDSDERVIITKDSDGNTKKTVIRDSYTRVVPRTSTTHRYHHHVRFLRSPNL